MKTYEIMSQQRRQNIIFGLIIMILPLIFSKTSTYLLVVAGFAEIYIIAVSGLDIVFGYCGQISLGHAAFYALGAYGSALVHEYLGVPIILSMIISSIIATIIGALLAYPASNLVFHFLSLSTIAFGEIVYVIISHSPNGITGNFNGLFSDFIDIFGFKINTNTRFYYFGLICVIIFLAIKTSLVKSKIGRAFLAIRENTHAADGMGINVRLYKVMAFATSVFYTAFAGSMYIHFVRFVHPDTFTQKQSVLFLTMLLFGGTGSLMGPIIGSIAVLILTELLRSLQNYQMFIYGILLLIVIVLIPGGLYSTLSDFVTSIKSQVMPEQGAKTHAKN